MSIQEELPSVAIAGESPHVDLDIVPTPARWGVLFFLCTLALLLYIDRICIGQAETSIRREL
jgi:hypothetical protein